MFDIGWGELVVIGIVALIAIGPKELTTVLRSLGLWMGKIRRMAAEFQGQFQEAMREAEMADLKKQADDLTNSVTGAANFDPMASTQKEMERAFELPEAGKATEPSAAAATAVPSVEPATPLPQVTALPDINVPLPEPPAPVGNADFAAVETPPPKKAGGGA